MPFEVQTCSNFERISNSQRGSVTWVTDCNLQCVRRELPSKKWSIESALALPSRFSTLSRLVTHTFKEHFQSVSGTNRWKSEIIALVSFWLFGLLVRTPRKNLLQKEHLIKSFQVLRRALKRFSNLIFSISNSGRIAVVHSKSGSLIFKTPEDC